MKRQWYYVIEMTVALMLLFVSAKAYTKQVSSSNIQVASRALFGLAQSVVVDGGYAYIAADNSVITLSLSTPSAPVYTSFSYPVEYIQDIASNSDYIFATIGNYGIEVIPKSTSSDSSTIKTYYFGTFMGEITIDRTRGILYVATQDSGVMIISISGDSLSKVGTINGGFGTPRDVRYSNDTLVVGGSGGICLYNVSTPSEPYALDSIITKYPVYRVGFEGGVVVYVMHWTLGWNPYYTVTFFDSQENQSIESGEGRVADVCVRDSSIFVLNSQGNLSFYRYNSGNIQKMDEMTLSSLAHDMDADSEFVYLIEDDGFHVIEYSSGTLTSVSTVYSALVAYGLETYQNYLYIAAGQDGIMIIDMNDTLNPRFVGRVPFNKYSMALSVRDSFLLCASLFQNLSIFNISSPVNPAFTGSVYVPGNPMDLTWKDTVVYVATNTEGVALINVSSPGTPSVIGRLNTGNTTQSVEVHGNYLVVSDLHSGSYLYSVQDADNPSFLTSLSPSRTATLNDSLLVLATPDTQLAIYDIKDPQNPLLLYTISLPENANSVKISGNMLYVSCGDSGIRVYTLGNSDATLAGYFESGNRTNDVLPITSSLFYISEEAGGLYLLSGTFAKTFDVVEKRYNESGIVLRKNIGHTLEFGLTNLETGRYRVLDIAGRVMVNGVIRNGENVRLEGLKRGVYSILVDVGTEQYSRKVIIE